MDNNIILRLVTVLVPMILSLTVHEFAHAFAAHLLGDNTAKYQGRLTLNPLPHIDPIGTLLLPVMAVAMSGMGVPFFGWAKPVPVNPLYFNKKYSMRTGMLLTAAAGPLSNLIMAIISGGLMTILVRSGLLDHMMPVFTFLITFFQINLVLAIFNLVPIYPLDGQKVLTGLLPHDAANSFDNFSHRYGSLLLIGLIVFGGRIISIPLTLAFAFLGVLFGLPI